MKTFALPWFPNKLVYDAVRKVAGTKDMNATFEEWEVLFKKLELSFTSKGDRVIRSVIDANELIAFCKLKGLNVDSKGRMRYAIHWAQRNINDSKN